MTCNRSSYRRHSRRPYGQRDPEAGTRYEPAGGGTSLPPRTRRLYRDPRRAKIGGICAGIAAYYGVEPWVVRCIAVTGLLFFPSIVFPAYWIAYFLLDKPPEPRAQGDGGGDASGHGRQPRNHNSPAPELGSRLSPRNSLRNVQADLAEAELRLRRMERHVTSGPYELQRELNKIDGGGPASPMR